MVITVAYHADNVTTVKGIEEYPLKHASVRNNCDKS